MTTIENIKPRIHFLHPERDALSYFTDKENLYKLSIGKHKEFKNLFEIKIGTIVTIGTEKFKVIDIQTTAYDEEFKLEDYMPTEFPQGNNFPYNFDITYVITDYNG